MNTIYLVRHAENTANITKEFSYKNVDYSLTPKGVIQAQQTAAYFKGTPIDALYCSPLKRTRETAQIIGAAIGLTPVVMENFREINVGSLEGQPPTEEVWAIHNRILLSWFTGTPEQPFPDGENYISLLERMSAGLREITRGKDNQQIIVVGHGGIFSATIKDICQNVNLRELLSKENHNCAITEIEVDTNGEVIAGTLKDWASHTHMSGEAAELVSGFIRTA